MPALIGRNQEICKLDDFYNSGRPELVIVYGRRRVGKTFLIREHFKNKFAFYFTGSLNVPNTVNLAHFDSAIVEYGGTSLKPSKNWTEAFEKLRSLLSKNAGHRKLVFIDEMPWLDAQKSNFLASFDYFWNSWASANSDILFIGCGSATSWITKHIFKNKGGLHNRITGRINLSPFSIGECEQFFNSRDVVITRYQLAECYMIFGGIPYYLNLFDRSLSFSQNVDRLCFSSNAPLKNEFEELYFSLYKNPDRHIKIVQTLASKHSGLNRAELSATGNLLQNGHLTQALRELEECDFIESFSDFTKKANGAYYYLKDPFTLFYLRFMKSNNTKDEYFWTNYIDDGGHRAWSGFSFELLCRIHIRQIKIKLGIHGVSTNTTSWRSKGVTPGAQIDLVISRKDGVINLCEVKYSKHPYEITKSYAGELERKKSVFSMETGSRQALHTTMITTYGVARKGYFTMAQSEVSLDDLFVL